jgi:phage baseplate assembly protein W
MIDKSSKTDKALEGLEHLRQSIRNILTTPIDSRIIRRDYRSRLLEPIDWPINKGAVPK